MARCEEKGCFPECANCDKVNDICLACIEGFVLFTDEYSGQSYCDLECFEGFEAIDNPEGGIKC